MGLPLRGLRVIDLTKDFAGPFCTMILSDLGAEVIKVEKPGLGDETRAWGPPFVGGLSYYFLSINRGKKSITLNLKTHEAQRIVQQLVRDSDILVESFRPGTLAQLNLDYPHLRRINKALVYCSISGFGQTGPYKDRPGYDIVAFAMSGIMSTTGEERRPPIRVSIPVADIAAGHYAATGILAALARRLVTGKGEYIDVSLLDSIVSWLTYNATKYFATGEQPRRFGSAHQSIVPYQAFRCKDKYLIVAVGNDLQWGKFCEASGLRKLSGDRRFVTNPLRVANRGILVPILSRVFSKKNAEFWFHLLTEAGVPATPVYAMKEVVKDEQLRVRKMIVRPKIGVPQLSSPIRFSTVGASPPTQAPRLGQHSEEVLEELGYSRQSIVHLKDRGVVG